MAKEKYLKDIGNLFNKSSIVSHNSIEKIIKNKKSVRQYTKQLIRNLILKGKIKRLTKGYYTIHSDPSLIVFCFKPAYLGLQDALSFHNLWEQEAIPIIITASKIRPGIRKVFGHNVLIRRINKKYLFGFDYFKEDAFYMPYSDIEKTLIDLIYFKEKLDPGLIKILSKRINKKKLENYLRFYPKKFRKKTMAVMHES